MFIFFIGTLKKKWLTELLLMALDGWLDLASRLDNTVVVLGIV
jgi:hypothetical protein